MPEEEDHTFQRCPHDKENPYCMISRELIRDKSISPECRWLIIYLLANRDDWKIHMREIVNHCSGHVGRNRVYEVVNEAINSGYMRREEYLVNNMTRIRYFISESAKFKKSFRHTENRDAETRDPENGHSKEKASSNKKQKKVSTPSAGASALSTFLHAKIKKMKPNFSKSITPDWYSNADKLLKVRSPDEIRKVIDWAFEDPFWSTVIQSTKSLFKSIDTIEMQMLKKKTGSSALDRFKENSRLADQMRKKFEGHPDIDFGRDYVVFKWGPNSQTPINFSDNGFQEQVINKLRKMCLPIDGLI